jgi:hypothetical protein
MSRKDQLLRILAALDGHFAADDCSPADADRWRELKRHITRIKDGLDLARIELESLERGAPQTKEIVGKALQHVRLGSARKPASAMGAAADGRPRRRLSHRNPTIAARYVPIGESGTLHVVTQARVDLHAHRGYHRYRRRSQGRSAI